MLLPKENGADHVKLSNLTLEQMMASISPSGGGRRFTPIDVSGNTRFHLRRSYVSASCPNLSSSGDR